MRVIHESEVFFLLSQLPKVNGCKEPRYTVVLPAKPSLQNEELEELKVTFHKVSAKTDKGVIEYRWAYAGPHWIMFEDVPK
jgi:hypothetical protein